LGAAVTLTSLVSLRALATRSGPGALVDLRFPLMDGTYLVANGGESELVNAHLMTLKGERFRAYRGQSYGVDLVKLGALGLRARGVIPHDPEAHAIFGDLVVAPCAGTVMHAEDGHHDLRSGTRPPAQFPRTGSAADPHARRSGNSAAPAPAVT
jgi:hypothetical protein